MTPPVPNKIPPRVQITYRPICDLQPNPKNPLVQDWEAGSPSTRREELRALLLQVVVLTSGLRIQVKVAALRSRLGLPPAPADQEGGVVTLTSEGRLKRGGRGLRFVIPGPEGAWGDAHLDRPLIQTLAKARAWYEQLIRGEVKTREEIARRCGTSGQQVARLLPCAWLAPDIVETILEGRQPQGLTVKRLLEGFPMDWAEQRQVLGFPPKA